MSNVKADDRTGKLCLGDGGGVGHVGGQWSFGDDVVSPLALIRSGGGARPPLFQAVRVSNQSHQDQPDAQQKKRDRRKDTIVGLIDITICWTIV
jgi:hypothetical protein